MPDANVAAKWFLDDEDDLQPARELRRRRARGDVWLVAPDCFFYEFGNIIRTAERRARITFERANEIMASIIEPPISTTPTRLLLRHALDRSRELQISFYDAVYLAAADMLGATFVTADRPLYERLRSLSQVQRLDRLV